MQIVAAALLERAKFDFVAKLQLFLAFDSVVIPRRFDQAPRPSDQASRPGGKSLSRFAGPTRGQGGPRQKGNS